MSDIAIKIRGISKQYKIGGAQTEYDRLGDFLIGTITSPFMRAYRFLRKQASQSSHTEETIWALKNVSMDIMQGDVVGIIGRNGAGKSTLLKILSRITEPTEGYADVRGRVGSLLDVGTGFHPELSGRENIYLNGAILGMGRAEITTKFDEIVFFAEIEKFIDTPVKHYSSGMYVRLAFSVAAHLEPEIMIVDEVLAVGDQAFQKKCLGKMGDVATQGRTVLFVSHNMGILQSLCQRGVLLQEGSVVLDGGIDDVVGAYLKSLEQLGTQALDQRTDRRGNGRVRLVNIEITGGDHSEQSVLRTGSSASFVFQLNGLLQDTACIFVILNEFGQPLTSFRSTDRSKADAYCSEEEKRFVCEMDELLLMPGRYHIDVLISGGGEWQDFIEAAAFFDVEPGTVRGRAAIPSTKRYMNFHLPHRWKLPLDR